MSDLGDLTFACKKIIPIKGEIEISETRLLEQIFDAVEVTHLDQTEQETEAVNGRCHEAEDTQTKLNDCEGIREQPYECNLRSDDSTSSSRNHDNIRPSLQYKHSCPICAQSFEWSCRLGMHMNIHTGCRPYVCTICSKAFIWPSNLRKHMLTHSAEAKNRTKFKCTLCEKFCSSKAQLNNHMFKHRNERPFKCETCPKTFLRPHSLSLHKKLHAVDGENECTFCNRKCVDNNKLRRHEKTHTNVRWKYHCDICKAYFKNADQYRNHSEDKCRRRTIGKTWQFQCTECYKAFATIWNLNQHRSQIHSAVLENNHTCSVCAKVCRCKKDLKDHMNTHTGSRPYACPICPKSFAWSQALSRHKLAHYQKCKRNPQKSQVQENEKNDKETQNQNEIENIGTDEISQKYDAIEKKYKCDECNKKFICERNLNFHLISHAKISST